MDQKLTFRYFYGNEADQYSFYRIPKLLFKNEYFKNLSSDAKILYGLMLDRMSLSIKISGLMNRTGHTSIFLLKISWNC